HRHADVCRLSVERLYGERNTMSAGQLEATLVAGERPGDLGDEVFGRSIPAATLLPAQRVQVLPGREVLVEGSVDQVGVACDDARCADSGRAADAVQERIPGRRIGQLEE